MSEIKSLCSMCINSIRCDTWGEWRCKKFEKRVYNHAQLTQCEGYSKRDKNFKETRCQCEDCLNNDLLAAEDKED